MLDAHHVGQQRSFSRVDGAGGFEIHNGSNAVRIDNRDFDGLSREALDVLVLVLVERGVSYQAQWLLDRVAKLTRRIRVSECSGCACRSLRTATKRT